jgi:hypothetical protein
MERHRIYLGAELGGVVGSVGLGLRGFRILVFVAALGLGFTAGPAAIADEAEIRIGNALADMLRAGRSVVSANQPLINDPGVGDKGFTGEKLIGDAKAIYAERTGTPLLAGDLSERDRRLLDAQMQAMRRIVDAHQSDINRRDLGFKGFIPAIFARLSNEEFEAIAGTEARIRVTAPADLVRNRKARPDPWEKNILETKLLAPDWPKGTPYTEAVEYEGRPAFRMLLPEYYRESCLTCHGGPKGETDITGYPKEGGKVGELGGVISIVIFR